jgi:hypothetical protein
MYQYLGFSSGMLGGNASYVFSRLGENWSSILRQTITIILINPSSENLSTIDSWPAEYREICPFTSQELQQITIPFTLIKSQDGKFRAVWYRMSIMDTKPFMLPAIQHSIFVQKPPVRGSHGLTAGVAFGRRSQYTR